MGSPTTTLPSATSNGNATKYVIPAMFLALLSTETLLDCFRVFAHGLVGEADEDRDSTASNTSVLSDVDSTSPS